MNWQRQLLNITTQNFADKHKQQEESNEERHKKQLALMQQQKEGKKDYGTTVPDTPISSFRLHCRPMERLSATVQDVW